MRAFLIYIDGTPLVPEVPLAFEEAIDHFRDQFADSDEDTKVEIRAYSFDTDSIRF